MREMAQVHDPEIPSHENPAYVEKARRLMADRDAETFGKGRVFAARTDQACLPPSSKEFEAVLAEHTGETEAQQGRQGLC